MSAIGRVIRSTAEGVTYNQAVWLINWAIGQAKENKKAKNDKL